jgi:hypothetical protein
MALEIASRPIEVALTVRCRLTGLLQGSLGRLLSILLVSPMVGPMAEWVQERSGEAAKMLWQDPGL